MVPFQCRECPWPTRENTDSPHWSEARKDSNLRPLKAIRALVVDTPPQRTAWSAAHSGDHPEPSAVAHQGKDLLLPPPHWLQGCMWELALPARTPLACHTMGRGSKSAGMWGREETSPRSLVWLRAPHASEPQTISQKELKTSGSLMAGSTELPIKLLF